MGSTVYKFEVIVLEVLLATRCEERGGLPHLPPHLAAQLLADHVVSEIEKLVGVQGEDHGRVAPLFAVSIRL